jgi:acyl-coenzyme A thioesterase PaaI-like protein
MWSAAALNERLAPLFPGTLGLRPVEVRRQKVSRTRVLRPAPCTAGDALHGGASMAFADALGRQTRRVLPA